MVRISQDIRGYGTMGKRRKDAVEKPPEGKSAKEIIQGFFDEIHKIDGIDPNVASIIKHLWAENRLGSDELLAVLEKERAKGENNAKEED